MTKHAVKTEEDILKAFEGESRAKWTYRAFAEMAENEGNQNVAKLFRAASEAEEIHANSLKRAFHETSRATKELWVSGMYDPKIVKDSTVENLKEAVSESQELSGMYSQMIQDAENDGWGYAKQCFTYAGAVDKLHSNLFKKFLDNPHKKEILDYYVCESCGNTLDHGPSGPCDVCGSSQNSFRKVK
jgi:rubrerythrin